MRGINLELAKLLERLNQSILVVRGNRAYFSLEKESVMKVEEFSELIRDLMKELRNSGLLCLEPLPPSEEDIENEILVFEDAVKAITVMNKALIAWIEREFDELPSCLGEALGLLRKFDPFEQCVF